MGIDIIGPPVEPPWRTRAPLPPEPQRRRWKRRRWLQAAVSTVFFPLFTTGAQEGPMAPTKVPPDVGTLFENYLDFVILDTGRYIFAALTKEHGVVVFDTDRTLYQIPSGDWGAPALSFRPSDGQLIVCSVSQGGEMIQIDAVPGIKKSG